MEVSVEKQEAGYRGSFQTRTGDTVSAMREVHGAACPEVVDALAVVVAIALRPEPQTAQPKETPAPEPRPTASERKPVEAVPKPAPAAAQPAPANRTPEEEPHEIVTATTETQVDVPAGVLRFDAYESVTVFGGATANLVPGVVMPRVDASLLVVFLAVPPGNTSYIVGPPWRLRSSWMAEVERRAGDLTTSVSGLGVALGACFPPHLDFNGFGILLCSEIGLQHTTLKTTDTLGATIQSKETDSGTFGFGVEAMYHIGIFQVAMKLTGDFNTSPLEAERADGSELFKAFPISGYAALGAGAHF
jgi:hypothetical protein